MRGVGEEPLADDHLELRCQARERIRHTFPVVNDLDEPVTFAVESDLPQVSGPSELVVPARSTGAYELTMNPLLGGTYTGSVTFVAGGSDRYRWFTIELVAAPPDPEATLEVSAQVRGAVASELYILVVAWGAPW